MKKLFALSAVILMLCACASSQKSASSSSLSPELVAYMKQRAALISTMRPTAEKDETYGYTKQNPILAGAPQGAEAGITKAKIFLEQYLRDWDGLPFTVTRAGNVGNVNGDGIIDQYKLTRVRTGRSIYVYVNSYKEDPSGNMRAPKNMHYLPDADTKQIYDEALNAFLQGNYASATEGFIKIEDKTPLAALHLALIDHKDEPKAFSFYQKAANMGSPNGYCALGSMYMRGWGVKKDFKKGFDIDLDCADRLNESLAQAIVGGEYFQGAEVKKDLKKARAYAEKSAMQGAMPGISVLVAVNMEEEKYVDALAWAMFADEYLQDPFNLQDKPDFFTPEEVEAARAKSAKLKEDIVFDKRHITKR